MTLTIELTDDLDAALKAQAPAKVISAAGLVRQLFVQVLMPQDEDKSEQPLETGREVPRADVLDMPDRIVAAAAVFLGVLC